MAKKKRSSKSGRGKTAPQQKRAAKKSARRKRAAAPAAAALRAGSDQPLDDEEIELALVTGRNRAELERLFGLEDYAELRELARASGQARTRGAQPVLILPGIMGSTLGSKRKFLPTWDTLWLDFSEVIRGKLIDLSLEGGKKLQPIGVILMYYLKLKLRLRKQGFRPEFYPYDWRLSIDRLGKDLADHLGSMSENVSLVAHSMGGLVSRAAIAHLGEKSNIVQKLIMLGTPNHGSYSPVEAFRGTSTTLRKLAKLDLKNSAEDLVDKAFAPSDGLIQMMPFGGKISTIDFFKPTTWPAGKFRPRTGRFANANKVHKFLATVRPEDLDRFFLIAGIGQETAVGATFENGEFEYQYSQEGDGTVPLQSALLDGIKQTYYISEQHGALPNNSTVAEAVGDLLRRGKTDRLPTQWAPPQARSIVRRSEAGLRAASIDLEPGREPSQEEKRQFLEEFLAPSQADKKTPHAPDLPGLESLSERPVVIGRRRQHQLDMTLAHGSIADVNAEAIILGIYQGVAPSGAAQALDVALGGEISRVVSRRLFSADTGEVFILPVSRRRLMADFVVFVGLGFYDEFSNEVLELACQNTARILLAAQITDFATVMIGSASAASMNGSLRSMMRGYAQGMADDSHSQKIRSVTVVEYDETRFQQMTRAVVELAVSDVLDGVEITIETLTLEPSFPTAISRSVIAEGGPEPFYLIVRQEAIEGGNYSLQASLLTSGGKATVVSENKVYEVAALDKLLQNISQSLQDKSLKKLGNDIAELVLPAPVRALLQELSDEARPIVVLHDSEASKIPWETLRIDDYAPALSGGLSRQFMTDMPIAKWLEARTQAENLKILLIVDPTSDLPGAFKEGQRIKALLESNPHIEITEVLREEATWARLEDEFRSGEYDIVHYAGHAFFDPVQRSRSGLLCSDKRVLSGEDLAGIGNLPTLVFFNACEAGRIRGGAASASSSMAPKEGGERILRNVSLSEAFLRGGVSNYIGTFWPVGDLAAEKFADKFYTQLLEGRALGEALNSGRAAVAEAGSADWADYMHYGDIRFRLKRAPAGS